MIKGAFKLSGNTFGTIFKVTTFGESHGKAIGAVIDGCPSNIPLSEKDIQTALNKRKPKSYSGNGFSLSTTRNEPDTCEILSGVFEGVTLGTPIAILIRNTAALKTDYENLKDVYRPNHADFSYEAKFKIRDFRGGGRASGRETAARVAAGAVAEKFLKQLSEQKIIPHLQVKAYAEEVAGIKLSEPAQTENDLPHGVTEKLKKIRTSGDSAGAVIACRVTNPLKGLGEPVFSKLDAELSKAVMSIGGVKGIEFGSGFSAAAIQGSENNCKEKNAGGILGGISDGSEIFFRLAVKPVPSISVSQKAVNKNGETIMLYVKGRHDICLFPRILPVVEAMTWLTLADAVLLQTRNIILN